MRSRVARLKHCSTIAGRIGWHGLSTSDYLDYGDYLITGTEIANGGIEWGKCHRVEEKIYDQDPHIQLSEGDVLVTKDGTIGKVARIGTLPGRSTLNSGIFRIIPHRDQLKSGYLYWVLSSRVFFDFVDLLSSGSTIEHLYQRDIINLLIPMPDLNSQGAIADYLDRETARIDSLIEKKRQMAELLNERRQVVITEAVTGKLDIPGSPKRHGKMKDSGIEWIGEIPEGWKVVRLKRISPRISTGGTPLSEKHDDDLLPLAENTVFTDWFTPSDFGSNIMLEPAFKKLDNPTIQFPSQSILVVCIGATLGKVGLIKTPSSSNQQINAIEPSPDVNAQFLAHYLASITSVLKMLSLASTLSILNQERLGAVVMPFPPLPEQQVIVDYLDRETVRIDALVEKIDSQIGLLSEKRQALITAAVTGELDIAEMIS